MAEDVTLSVGADTGKARADMASLRKVVEEFFSSLGLGKSAAAAFAEAYAIEFTKVGASTEEAKARLEELRPELSKLAEEARTAGSGTGEFSFNLKDMAKNVGAGISVLGVLRENLQDLAPILERNGELLGDLAVSAGADEKTLNGLSLALDTLLHPTHAIANANKAAAEASRIVADAYVGETEVVSNLTAEQRKLAAAKGDALRAGQDREAAIKKEREENAALAEVLSNVATEELKNGDVSKRTREEIEKLNQAYADTGDQVPPKLAAVVAQLGILTNEQEKAGESAEREAERAAKAADKRAAAEEKATERALAAIEKERAAKAKALDEEIAASQKRLDAALAKGAPIDTSQAAGGDGKAKSVADELQKVKGQIDEIERSPLITVEQMNKLPELKDRARELGSELRAAGEEGAKVFTVTGANFLTEAEAAEAASAAHDHYLALLNKSAAAHDEAIDATERGTDATEGLTQAVEETGKAYEVVSEKQAGWFAGDETETITQRWVDAKDSVEAFGAGAEEAFDTVGAGAETVGEAAGEASTAVDELTGKAKELGEVNPGESIAEGLAKAKTGVEENIAAADAWLVKLREVEEVSKRIAEVLGSLALGSDDSGAGGA